MIPNSISRYIHIGCLSGLGIFLPLSEYMTSVFIILLALNWLINFNAQRLSKVFKVERKSLFILLSFLVYILWFFISDDKETALGALRLKLPLIALPVIIISTPVQKFNERKIILYSFLLGVMIASLAGLINFAGKRDIIGDPHEMALYISHIRLSLMLILAVCISVLYAFKTRKKAESLILLISAIWYSVFLIMILSITGYVISAMVLLYIIIRLLRGRSVTIKLLICLIPVLCISLAIIYIVGEAGVLFPERDVEDIDYNELTASGNPYLHFPERKDMENGYYVWRYISYTELTEAWNQRSIVDFDSLDLRGHKIEYTIIRYLSSAGLRKDSAGVASLSKEDISIIEAGYASRFYLESGRGRIKLYELLWQIDYYINGGNPQGHSITQRIEFWKTSLRLFRKNIWFGCGTGDFKALIAAQYKEDNSLLDEDHRLSTHNQYLLSLATLGIVGALIFWFGLIRPLISARSKKNILLHIFIIIAFLSMLWEDTLETHTGVSFFAWAYFVLLYYPPEEKR